MHGRIQESSAVKLAGSIWVPVDAEAGTTGARKWSLAAVGDLSLCNGIRRSSVCSTALSDILGDSDLRLANLEGAVPGLGKSVSKPKTQLRLDRDAIMQAKKAGFDLLTLANNHVMDYGEEGLNATLAELDRVGLAYCGAGKSQERALQPSVFDVGEGVRVSCFSVCGDYLDVAGESRAGFAWIGSPEFAPMVREEKESGSVVIICVHCGIEDVPLPPVQLQNQLRRLIDWGADLVIGTHPHVPQGFEAYNAGLIFYSLGNFLFDSPTGAISPKRDVSILIQASFAGSVLLGCWVVPLEQHRNRVRLMSENEHRDIDAFCGYLLKLRDILTCPATMTTCWQELAIWLFYEYYLNAFIGFKSLDDLFKSGTSSGRIVQSWHFLKELAYLWMPYKLRSVLRVSRRLIRQSGIMGKRHLAEKGRSEIRLSRHRTMLSAPTRSRLIAPLTAVRVETTGWSVDTALSVLSGHTEDLRSPESAELITLLLRDSCFMLRPEHLPFMKEGPGVVLSTGRGA